MKKSPRFDWFLKKETCWHSPTSFASGVGAWGAPVQGVKAYPKSLDSLKIWAKSLKFRTKSLNIWTKSLKIWAKMAPNFVWLQKMSPDVCRKAHGNLFGGHTKSGLHDLCWRKYVCKTRTKFSGKFGEIRAKFFTPPKFAYFFTYVYYYEENNLPSTLFKICAEFNKDRVCTSEPAVHNFCSPCNEMLGVLC